MILIVNSLCRTQQQKKIASLILSTCSMTIFLINGKNSHATRTKPPFLSKKNHFVCPLKGLLSIQKARIPRNFIVYNKNDKSVHAQKFPGGGGGTDETLFFLLGTLKFKLLDTTLGEIYVF